MLRRSQDRLRRILPGGKGRGRGIVLAVAAIVVLWVASGFYRVEPDEQGIVLRFGAYNRTTGPGLNYHLPDPIEAALTPKVTRVNRVEIGFRSIASGVQISGTEIPTESLMLTGDENIIDINFVVLWVIKDARDYLFNVRNPDDTVKAAAESAMREVIGQEPARERAHHRPPQDRGRYADAAAGNSRLLQSRHRHHAGSAPEGRSAGAGHRCLPRRAKRQDRRAAPHQPGGRLSQQRRAGGARRCRAHRPGGAKPTGRRSCSRPKATPPASFRSTTAYKAAEDVTARRLYIETMQDILQHTNKIILDKGAAGSGVVPYLPLPQLLRPQAPSSPAPSVPTPPAPQGSTPMSSRSIAIASAAAVVVLILLYSSVFTVSQIEQALVLQFGKPIRVVTVPGLHFKLPWQDVIDYDRRILDFEPPAEEVIASDQKRLVVDSYARFRITDPLQFYQSLGTEAVRDNAALRRSSPAMLRRVIGDIELQDVISTRRASIMRQIRDEVNAQIDRFRHRRGRRAPEARRSARGEQRGGLRADEVGAPTRSGGIPGRGRAPGAGDPRRCRPPAHRDHRRCAKTGADPARPGRCRQHQDLRRRLWPDKNFYSFYRSLQAYRDGLSGPSTTLVLSPDSEFFRFLESGPPALAPAANTAAPAASAATTRAVRR